MKINKNILLAILTPILFFSAAKIASADTHYIVYTAVNPDGKISSSVNVQIEHRLNGGNLGKFKPGDTITPYVYVNPKQDIRCANGQTHEQSLYAYKYNLEIGKPDNSKYLTLKKLTEEPDIYLDSTNNIVYVKPGQIIFDAYNNILLDASAISSAYPQLPYNASEIRVKTNSLENLRVNAGGKLAGEFDVEYYDGYGGTKQTTHVYDGILTTDPRLDSYSNTSYIPNYTASLYTITTNMRPLLGGTNVYGNTAFPDSVYIPTNATPGQYVAQFKFRPSYTVFTPPYGVTTGAWNTTAASYKTCPDGTRILSTETCPTFVSYKICPDGTKILATDTCPATVTYQTCADGSRIPSTQTCPATKTCKDGTVVLTTETCYKTCPDGQVVPETKVCPKPLPTTPGDCSDPRFPCEATSFFETLFNINKANALIAALEADVIMMNGGGGGGDYNTSYTPPPTTCDPKLWYCQITFYEVPLSDPFEVISNNVAPAVQVK